MNRAAWALGLIVMASLAGCIGGDEPDPDAEREAEGPEQLSPINRQHSVGQVLDFEAESDDGMFLRGHVYLPEGDGPFATVLSVSPYFDTGDWRSDNQVTPAEDGRQTMTYIWQDMMDAGFAVALVSVRGSGLSEGCFTFAGKQTWTDMYHVVETLAAQPWSNGNIGMQGISYDGWTQYMAIAGAPPSLKATIPMSSVLDYWSLITRQGAPIWYSGASLSTEWTIKSSAGGFVSNGLLLAVLGYNNGVLDAVPVVPDPSHFDCPDEWLADLQTNMELITNGDTGPYFEERNYVDAINATEVPMLVTNGLQNGEGHILQVEGLWPLLPEENRRMVLGQWEHDIPHDKYPEWSELAVAWFDHYLRDGPRTFDLGVVDYQDTDGTWHRADQWPPAAHTVDVYLRGDTLTLDEDASASGAQTFQWLRSDPHPTRCGPFQAAYVSPPLTETVHLAGNYDVSITLTSDQPDGNLAAFLYHTSGSGTCPDLDATEVRRAIADLRHVGDRTGAAFPIGTPTAVTLHSHPMAVNVPAGDRLVLLIGSESDEITPDGNFPTYTVTTGPDQIGALRLPVVDGTLGFS